MKCGCHLYVRGRLKFLAPDECKHWLAGRWQPDFSRDKRRAVLTYSNIPSRQYFISRWIAKNLSWDSTVLLWVGDTIVSGNNSNWHLYYRLRESYGDRRLINDVPGHLCLNYEAEDLATLIYLTMLNGWDASFIPELGYVSLQFSHDGFIDVFSDDDSLVAEIQKNASDGGPVAK